MRLAPVALLLVAACYRAPTEPKTPTNKTEPVKVRVADDVLAMLPIDSHIVMHLDMAKLRASPLWERQLAGIVTSLAGPQLETFQKLCGFDSITSVDRVSLGLKSNDAGADRIEGVVVGHGSEAQRGVECLAREGKDSGKVRTDDNLVFIKTNRDITAVTVVGSSTVVLETGSAVTRESVGKVLASGSPLRGSPAFLAMYERLEPGAQLWFAINGNAPMFSSLSAIGFRPKSIDGTLTVGETYVLAVRGQMNSADEANRLVTMLDGNSQQVRQMVEQFDVRAEGDSVRVDMVLTDAQVQTLTSLVGGFMGP